jgi:hypothetical protein
MHSSAVSTCATVLSCLVLSCQSTSGIEAERSNGSPGQESYQGSSAEVGRSGEALVRPSAASWASGKTYLFELHSGVTIDIGSGRKAVSYGLSSRAEISVVEHAEGRETLHLRLVEPAIENHLQGDKSNLDRLVRELQERDCVFVLSGGRIVEFGLRRGAPSLSANTLKQIAASLQVAVPRGSQGGSWEEYDTTGRYEAQYRFDEGSQSYLKKKLRYLALLGRPTARNGSSIQIVPEVVKSEGRIRLSSDGRLESVESRDDLVIRGAQVPFHSSTSIGLRLVSVAEMLPGGNLNSPLSVFELTPASEPDGPKANIEALDKARTEGATFREIVARVEADRAGHAAVSGAKSTKGKLGGASALQGSDSKAVGDPKLFDALAASLRSQDGAVREAVRMTVSKPAISMTLIDALSSASCSECEAALIGMLASENRDVKNRALYGLARMPRPGDKAVATMKQILEKKPYDPTALYALGSYSRRFRDDGKLEHASELGELLTKRLSSAVGSMQVVTVLRAIGNSGYAGALAAVSRYVDDANGTVQGASILALGPMKDSAVDGILASRLRPESSTETRLSVIEAAQVREPSGTLASAIAGVYQSSAVSVRHRAVDLFARWLPRQPNLRGLLEKISQSDPEERIRARAKALL